MSSCGAGRYAPSPSGQLHVGNLRTAMVAWLCARKSEREFLIRIEDVDRGRDAGAADTQLEELAAIGLDWDRPPVFQTHRREAHESAIERLRARGLVYECTCTRREILEAPSAPHAAPGAYPGKCRDRSDTEREAARKAIAPRLPALRLRTSVNELEFNDLLLGKVRAGVDDFVLQRGDGAIAYNLAVVVDDAEMGIDQVVRGDDLAPSTPRQILLQQLLGLPTPSYAHVALVLGPTGARLAKRDGAVTLEELAQQGTSVAEVRDLLATSLGLSSPGEMLSMQELVLRFELEKLPKKPWVWGH